MAPLKHPKQERFVREYLNSPMSGLSQAGCYIAAGYRVSTEVATVNACRLLSNPNVVQRMAELRAPALRKARATVESLAEQFDAVFDAAMGDRQLGAAGSAAAAKAKLLGFMRDKIEIGRVGEFDACETPESVAHALCATVGAGEAADALNLLAGLLEATAGHQARDVSPAPRRIGSTFESKWPNRIRRPVATRDKSKP